MDSRVPGERTFFGTAALLFAASAAVTVAWGASMTGMPGMEMPGGWSMSMAWMRMPAQTWLAATATFLGMWSVMMLAMMLPAITPALRAYRRGAAGARANSLTLRVATAYFGAWMLAGAAVYPLGLAFAESSMRLPALSRAVPVLAAAALLIAGLLQLGKWKRRQLDCCRSLGRRRPAANGAAAWRHGWRLGLRCVTCCAPLTLALLVVGVMDLAAMGAATAAICLERLAPRGAWFARISGALLVGTALLLLRQAATA